MPFLILLATLAFALSPLLSPGFGGFEDDQFPIPQIDPPVQPAGYAFGIWGLIYALLIAAALYGVWQRRSDPQWQAMRLPLLVTLVVGATWLPIAQTSAVWATVLIWIMWAFAVWAVLNAPRGDGADKWLGRVPVALYAGWLTAASCVSLGLMAAGYGAMNQTVAAILALLIALGLALWVARQRPDALGYLAGVIWALIGVCVQNATGGSTYVLVLAAAGAAALIAVGGNNIKRT
ncbi:TspO/MBR family protein [Roseovarius sp. D0-M9]|uniref:TspO/MBR family protein n=1 Tax=Roseovarius sp. D0-M9 TaxID=3127117 RepID=UPI003010331A